MKTLVPNYTLSGNTVTLGGVNTPLGNLLFISDADQGNVLYSPAGPALIDYSTIAGGNAVATLASAPTTSDRLLIYYDNGVNPTNAPSTVTVGGGSLTLGAGTATIGKINSDVSGSGTVTPSVPLAVNTLNFGTLTFQSNNAATGTITIEGTVDGTTWTATTYSGLTSGNYSSNFNAGSATCGQINTSGLQQIRFRSNTISGTATISYTLSRTVSNVMLDNALPSGTNVIGKVGIDSNANGVTISNTVPVSGSLTAYGSDSLGTLHQLRTDASGDLITARTWNLSQGNDTVYASLGSQSLSVTGNFYPATQPVSGSVSVSNFPSSQSVSVSNFPSSQSLATQFVTGQQTLSATTPVQLPNKPATRGVVVTNQTGVNVFLGSGSGLTANNGYVLGPGSAGSYSITNLNLIYCLGSASMKGNLHYTVT